MFARDEEEADAGEDHQLLNDDTDEEGPGEKVKGMFVEDEVDPMGLEPDPMPEDLYGAAVESIIRDTQMMATGGAFCLRYARILATLALLLGVVALQVFLLACVKKFISARQVREIREIYSDFQEVMYRGNVRILDTGFARGINDDDFDESQFYNDSAWIAIGQDDPEDARDSVCQIPLSQPWFLGAVLLLWTFTVLLQVVGALHLLFNLCLVPSKSIEDVIERPDPEEPKELLIVGLPWWLKIPLGTIILLQLAVTFFLLWLGCRWLTATNDFGDLLLNAVALEFILLLKESIFLVLVSERSKREVLNTSIPNWRGEKFDHSGWFSFLGRIGWLVIALLWVILYMVAWQHVLPSYRWDVHDVCEDFIREHYSVKKDISSN